MSTLITDGHPPPSNGEEVLLTKTQLARLLDKSERTIDYWRKQIGLPCLKIKHSVFFRRSEVLKHLERLGRTLDP